MKSVAKRRRRRAPAKRSYQSPVRASLVAANREAIVEAATRLLRTSPGLLTVPRVAELAGVSVPTVNRHFPSRKVLLEAVVDRLDRSSSHLDAFTLDSRTVFEGEGLSARPIFEHFGSMNIPDALFGQSGVTELRTTVTIPRRRKFFDEAIAFSLPTLHEPHRTWLSDLMVVLVSSSMVHVMRSYLGLEGASAADRIDWLLRTLIAEARRTASSPKEAS